MKKSEIFTFSISELKDHLSRLRQDKDVVLAANILAAEFYRIGISDPVKADPEDETKEIELKVELNLIEMKWVACINEISSRILKRIGLRKEFDIKFYQEDFLRMFTTVKCAINISTPVKEIKNINIIADTVKLKYKLLPLMNQKIRIFSREFDSEIDLYGSRFIPSIHKEDGKRYGHTVEYHGTREDYYYE